MAAVGHLLVQRAPDVVELRPAWPPARRPATAGPRPAPPAGPACRVGPQPHHGTRPRQEVRLAADSTDTAGRRHHHRPGPDERPRPAPGTPRPGTPPRPRAAKSSGTVEPVRPLDLGIGVEVRHPSAAGQQAATVVLPAPIIPTRTIRSAIGRRRRRRRRASRPARRGSRRRLRRNSATESPPNFRSASEASTRAIIVSATTPMAGTAVTSVRSLNDTVDSLVTTSTVPERRPVERGQRLHRQPGPRSGAPVRHPALDARRRGGCRGRSPRPWPARSVGAPASATRMASWASEPRRPATSVPSPISTALTAWMLMRAWASRASRRRSQCTWLPEADRHAVGDDLGHAAERVTVLGRRLDRGHHPRLGVRVDAPHLGLVDPPRSLEPGQRPVSARSAPSCTMWLSTSTPICHEQELGHGARRPPGPPSRGPRPAPARHGRRRART